MFDLSGLFYKLKSECIVFGVVGLLFLVSSRFWKVEKRNHKDLIIGVIFILLCICSISYHIYVINDLEIAVHEGAFIDENRANPYLFRTEYCFTNESGLKPLFYLDFFSKKNIYPDDLEKNVSYRIYYEEKTDIIVKIEKLE